MTTRMRLSTYSRVRCASGGGTDEWVFGVGGFVYLPRGLIHQVTVEGEHPAKVLAVLSRPGLEDFFTEWASELTKSGGPPTLEMADKVGEPYGLRHFPPSTKPAE
jgi:hypothetical protein